MAESNNKTKVVAVVGPTASGKTALAVNLAKIFVGEIVSGDSMQIYKHMTIGTAKPTEEEMQGVAHHLIDFLEPVEQFSLADYIKTAMKAIEDISSRKKLPIVAGGTGLYIDSLLHGITLSPIETDDQLRQELYAEAEKHGNEHMHKLLEAIDPQLATSLHPNNLGRVIRALEVFRLTGVPMSEHQRRSKPPEPPYSSVYIALSYRNRELLYERINHRVDLMVAGGLLDELNNLLKMGYSKTSFQAIGYKELLGYISGESSLSESIENIKMQTRRYAKRQLTWFCRNKDARFIFVDDYSSLEELVSSCKQIIETFLED